MIRTEYVILVQKWYYNRTGGYNYIWVEYRGYRYLDIEDAAKDFKMLNEQGINAILREVVVNV